MRERALPADTGSTMSGDEPGRSAARTRAVFEHILDQVLVVEAERDERGVVTDWRYVDANAEGLRVLGLARDGLVGRTLREVFPDRAATLGVVWSGVLATGEPARYEAPFRGHQYLVSAFRVDASTVATTTLDITERKETERRLRESERLYRAIGESIDFGVWVCAPDGRNIYASDSFLRLVGQTQEQCSSDGWADVLHPDDAERTLAAWKECVRAGGTWDLEHRFRGVDGQWHPILARGVPVRDERGELICWAGINLDIGRLKRAEEALRESDQRKSDFLAVLSHELRNPLAAIRSSLYLLERAPAGSPQAVRAREIIARQTGHLGNLVDDLLDIGRIDHGKITLDRVRLDSREAVRRACEDLRHEPEQRGVTVALTLDPEPVWVEADPTRLAQIVGNLLHNAVKFTPAGGRVEVSLGRRDAAGELCVRDTGIGIDPALLETIFEPFAQAERPTPASGGGLGIGLALVKSLVLLHGGQVRAESEGPGRGAAFRVTLPLCAPPEVAEVDLAAPALPTLSVLVVDDNQDVRDALGDVLGLLGHEAHLAVDGVSGLEVARSTLPDALICDVGLPDVSGYEVMRQVRRLAGGEGIFAVALTGYAQPDDVRRAREAGFDAHLPKPPQMDRLVELLGRAADRAAARHGDPASLRP